MYFHLFNNAKNKESSWIDFAMYIIFALLIGTIFCYFLFVVKIYFQNKEMVNMDKQMALYLTDERKKAEKEVLDYKKKIDGINVIMDNRKISSNVFNLIEANTLEDVWFSSFDMSGLTNKIILSGESETMEIFSRQVQAFEKSEKYIKSVGVTSLQAQPSGKIRFTLSISLDPNIFDYADVFLPTAVDASN